MRSRPGQQAPTDPVGHRLVLTILFWLLLALLAKGVMQGQMAPQPGDAIARKALREPSLYIASHLETVLELAASERAGAAQRLSALEVSPTAAFLDRRSGRWATLMTSVPLLPGSGVGNKLSWQEVTQRFFAGYRWKGRFGRRLKSTCRETRRRWTSIGMSLRHRRESPCTTTAT